MPNATAIPFGPPPTRIVLTTRFRFGAIRLTVPEPSFETQTEPAPKASAYGRDADRDPPRTFFVVGFTRVTRAPFREPTQTLPAP